MNRPRNPRPLGWGVGVVAIGALLSWSGCGDDTTLAGGPGAAAGPITVEEADTVFAEDGTVTDELCAVIPAAENVELLCNDGEFCGPGGLCVEPLGRAQGQCSQVCFPELCGNSCPGEETCATLLDGEGQPISFDINRDGTADVVGGACQLDAIGEQGTFESCGAAGACAEGLVCLRVDGRDEGTCFTACDGSCDAFETFDANCSFTTAGQRACLIPCQPSGAACPQGLECAQVGHDNYTCVR